MATTNIDLGANNSATITFHTKDKYNTEDMVFDIKRKDLGLLTCSTAAATAAKVINTPNKATDPYTPKEGDSIKVLFWEWCGAANATLNIDGTGAHPIVIRGSVAVDASGLNWDSGSVVELTYHVRTDIGGVWLLNDVHGWKPTYNSKTVYGVVLAPSTASATAAASASVASTVSSPSAPSVQAGGNAFWATDANGNPAWRRFPIGTTNTRGIMNDVSVAGIVPAPTSTHPNSVWKTNKFGVPSWQTEAEAGKWCTTPIIKHRDILGTTSNNDYVVSIADIDAAAGGANAWNELYIIVLFGGVTLIGKNIDMQSFQFTKDLLTSNFNGSDALPSTRHFNACYPLTIGSHTESHCDIRLYASSTSIELAMCKIFTYDCNTNINNCPRSSYTGEMDYLTGIHTGGFRHLAGHYVFPVNASGKVYTRNADTGVVSEEASTNNNYKRVNDGWYFIRSACQRAYDAGDSILGTNGVPFGSNCPARDTQNEHDLATMFVFWR